MIWLNWILSPVGRWLSSAGAVIALVFTIYMKGRREGKAAIEKEQDDERAKRAKRVVEADDRVRRDNASGRLLENDGHRRD